MSIWSNNAFEKSSAFLVQTSSEQLKRPDFRIFMFQVFLPNAAATHAYKSSVPSTCFAVVYVEISGGTLFDILHFSVFFAQRIFSFDFFSLNLVCSSS